MYSVEKRAVRKSGMASLGWMPGYGYRQEHLTVKKEGVWCVMESGKVFAECRSKQGANLIASALNAVIDGE